MIKNIFCLKDRVIPVTGAVGLLGIKHCEAVLEAEGVPILLDINQEKLLAVSRDLQKRYNREVIGIKTDITDRAQVVNACEQIINRFGRIDGLVNNAADNPKLRDKPASFSRFEQFPIELWQHGIGVGLTGALFCSQVFGSYMAQHAGGVILNVASDLGVVAPDQRIYRKDGLAENEQPVKPVTYSVVKHGLIGLTKYLATYWANKKIRVNAICPGGVYNNQKPEFVEKLTNLIPLGRMANADEYMGALVFLLSDASSYMTGSVVAIDGGRTCW